MSPLEMCNVSVKLQNRAEFIEQEVISIFAKKRSEIKNHEEFFAILAINISFSFTHCVWSNTDTRVIKQRFWFCLWKDIVTEMHICVYMKQTPPFFLRLQSFMGNVNSDSVIQNKLSHSVRTRFLRFVPVDWNPSGWIGLRVEVFGCSYSESTHITRTVLLSICECYM